MPRLHGSGNGLSPVLLGVTAVESVVLLVASAALLLAPDFTSDQWAWELAPFNTRFLGAIYASSFVPVVLLAVFNSWSAGRVTLPMIVSFTVVALAASLIHLDRFEFERWGAWVWFVLYIGIPLNGAIHLWMYRDRPTQGATQPGKNWRLVMQLWAAAWLAYALLLFAAPGVATDFWPWPVDTFHSQVYSAIFVAGGVGSLIASRKASERDYLALGLAFIVLGTVAIAAMIVVDLELERVDWGAAGTFGWLVMFALTLVMGLGLFRLGYRSSKAASVQEASA
jgi:hypothetical protein